jgi:hypothetical protein
VDEFQAEQAQLKKGFMNWVMDGGVAQIAQKLSVAESDWQRWEVSRGLFLTQGSHMAVQIAGNITA